MSVHLEQHKTRAEINSVLDWIDSEGRRPDWWEIANIRDAINCLHRGSYELAIRLAEYARVPQDERLDQSDRPASDTTSSLRALLGP